MTGRSYTVDGVRLPSVTHVIGAALSNPGIAAWRRRVGEVEAARISDEATDYGTAVHALVEQVNRHQRHLLGAEEQMIVQPYCEWFDENVSAVLAVEQLLVSHRYGYAGTTDAIVVLRGDRYPCVLDFKTSKSALGEAEWRVQLGAYAIAAEEHLGLVCRRRIIVRLSKKEPEKLRVHEFPEDDLEEDKQVFLALLKVFTWSQKHEPASKSIGRIQFGARS